MKQKIFFSAEANREAWSDRISWYQRLFRESLNGSVEGCIEALEEEPFISVRSKEAYGETPLHYAARGDQPEIAEFLLLKGAPPNAQDVFGDTPLMDALKYSSADVVEKLLLHPRINVKLANNDGQTALHVAAERGNADVIKKIIEKGAEIDKRDEFGNTPLITALSQCNLEAALALVDADADVKAWGMSGMSPAEILRLLEDRFATRNLETEGGDAQALLTQLKAKIGEPAQEPTATSVDFHEHFWRVGFDLPLPMVAQALAMPQGDMVDITQDLPQELARQSLRSSDIALQFLDSYARWQQSAIDENFARVQGSKNGALLSGEETARSFVEMRVHLVHAIETISQFAEENAKMVEAAAEGSFYMPPENMQENFWRTSFGIGADEANECLGEGLASHVMLVNAQVWSAWNDLQETEYKTESEYTGESVRLLRQRCAMARNTFSGKLDAWQDLQEHVLGRIHPEYEPQSEMSAAHAAAISEMAAGLAEQMREMQGRAPPGA